VNEAQRKANLVAAINALSGGYARRWEDKWAVGLLDLVMKLPGHPLIWGEGKIIEGLTFAPTLRQFEEGNKIQAAGMRAILIGWKGPTMFVSPWVKKVDCGTCFYGTGPNLAILQEFLNGRKNQWAV
jgi:hypothetical protein